MTFLPLLLKTVIRLGFKLPKTPSFCSTAPLPLSWFLATRFGRPIAIAAIAVTGLLLIPYFLIQPHFSFEDYVAKNSTALTAAEDIDEGVGGVAPLYVSVPLQGGRSPTSATPTSSASRRSTTSSRSTSGRTRRSRSASFDALLQKRLHPRARSSTPSGRS